MSEASNPIQQLLKALNDHSDLVAEAMKGPVGTGGKRDRGVEALIRTRALMPADEDTYYLNPLLREFIGDYVVSYAAFRQLTPLDFPIRQLRSDFDTLLEFRREGSVRDADRAMTRLEEAVVRVGFYMDQNLQLLSAKVTTNFGDVESVAGKIRENRFYYGEVKRFSRQIVSLTAKVQEMEGEALGQHLPQVRRLVNVRILSRLPEWTARIADVQRVVSKNLFALRQIEARARHLAHVALWLSKNRMSEGFDVDVSEAAAAQLWAPAPLASTWNIDLSDTDMLVTEGILSAAKKLPPISKPVVRAPVKPPVVVSTDQAVVQPPVAPVDELIDAYLAYIASKNWRHDGQGTNPKHELAVALSLVGWRRANSQRYGLSDDVTDEEWLLYACSQVASAGWQVAMVTRARSAGEFNDYFTDAFALPETFTEAQPDAR